MPVWPFLVTFAALCLAWGAHRGDRDAVIALAAMLGGYAATRALVSVYGDARLDIQLALIWIAVAHVSVAFTQLRVFPSCAALIGLCYFAAWYTAAPREFGSWPYVIADILAVAAMIGAVWDDGGGGNRILGRGDHRGFGVDLGHHPLAQEAQAARLGGNPHDQ